MMVLAGVFIGCKSTTTVQNKQQPDPLFISKKPVEGKPGEPEVDTVVRFEPAPPPLPERAGGTLVGPSVPLGAPQPLQIGQELTN